MCGHTEPGQLISPGETGRRVYQAQQRVGSERQPQAQPLTAPQQPVDQLPGYGDEPAAAVFLCCEGSQQIRQGYPTRVSNGDRSGLQGRR